MTCCPEILFSLWSRQVYSRDSSANPEHTEVWKVSQQWGQQQWDEVLFSDQCYQTLLLCYQHLGIIIFDFWIDSRAPDISGGKLAKTSESCGSPPTKRHKQEERDLGFLLVKNKDGQDCLFVDLGKRNREMICFSLLVLQHVIYKNRSLHQEQKFPAV